MAKGKNSGGPEQRSLPPLPNRDIFHRMNFAYQSAAFFQHLAAGPSVTSTTETSDIAGDTAEPHPNRRKRKKGTKAELPIIVTSADEGSEWDRLARKGTKEMKKMAVHTQVKMDPSIKRAICKSCSTVLIPGLTCRVRNRLSRSHTHITHHTCLACQSIRSIPNPPLTPPVIHSGSEETDTPNTQRKRRQIKAAFHDREQASSSVNTTGSGPVPAGLGVIKGHSMWRGDKSVSGWGAVPDLPDLFGASES